MSLPFNKKQVAKIITEVGADNLTAKGVRERLEQSLGMESNALKQYKQDISTMIDEVLKVCAHSQEPVTILSACDHACRCVPMRPRIRQRKRRRPSPTPCSSRSSRKTALKVCCSRSVASFLAERG
jgi:hypothetical protein